jgi:hypothetical protein
MKLLPALVLSFALVLSCQTPLFASGFQLQSIGTLDTTGYQYGEWWYSSPNPTLSGTTEPQATIEVTVDGVSQTITADSSGNWSAPTTMSEGDHTVSLSSSTGNYTFTVHIAQSMPAGVGTPSAMTQPVAGNASLTLAILFLGLLSIAGGFKLAQS